ncbi:MAG: hypothetical protein LUP00_03405 [Methanothrix sp.]|nr:hypothetical protein [Methanothrix sp.]
MAAAARALLDIKNPSFRGRRLLSPSPKIRRSRWSNAIAPARRAAERKLRRISLLGESVMKMPLSPDLL